MKVRVLYGSIVCVTCLFTLLIFQNFRKRWKTSEAFHRIVHDTPLNMRLLFIAPEQVKVENWKVGESSVYHLKTNSESKQISFHVAARDAKGSDRFWLKTEGFIEFNELEIEFWRLLNKTNLRPGSETRGFFFLRNGLPFPLPPVKFPPNPIILEKLGDEIVETPIGPIKCEHILAHIRSPDGELAPLLELWTNSTIHPLGLVRARWRDTFLDLVEVDSKKVPNIPPILLSEFDRDTPMDGSCSRCHVDEVGGKDLRLESMGWLRGVRLDLTEALFHHRQAKMVKTVDLIPIHFTEKSSRTRQRAMAQFSWKKGSFWVKPDKNGWLMLSLDTIAHQGNIIVQSNIGNLDLDISPRK